MTDLAWLTASQAVAMIAQKDLSPVEYLDALLSRAAAEQERLNPFSHVAAESARKAAIAAEAAVMRGDELGPLHGLPVHVKDLLKTKGIPTEYGSAIHAGYVPDNDDVLVARLHAAGGVMFAKSHTPEFGHKGQTDGPHFGTTRNPWDTSRYAGGSSGGAACAVAAMRDGRLVATPFATQDSSMLKTMAAANALIVRPPHAPDAPAGAACRVLMLR